jgi:ribosomal protein S18 acetylase RimI-like enzyme
MKIEFVENKDIEEWLKLVKEVEPLFGPMIGEVGFDEMIKTVIKEKRAYCIRENKGELCGVIVISLIKNEIEWFAVENDQQGKGYGKALLSHAMEILDQNRPVIVQTFDAGVPQGTAARKLYEKMGFIEYEKAEKNPAGISAVRLKQISI